MVSFKSLTLASLALWPLAAQATILWKNTGLRSQCDDILTEAQGTVAEVSNVVYEGSTALKMTQTFIQGRNGRYHSECRHFNGYKRGDERFYGFMFRLSESWQFQPQSYNLAQFIANRVGAGCDDDDWMPSTMVWLDGSQLKTRTKNGRYVKGDCVRGGDTFTVATPITAGQWHKVIIQARWKSDTTGFFKMWLDGNKVVEQFDKATTTTDDFQFEFRVGLYANGWFDDDGVMLGDQSFRQVWFDEIAIGTTFADVDPDQS